MSCIALNRPTSQIAHHVVDEHTFKDTDNIFYRFYSDESVHSGKTTTSSKLTDSSAVSSGAKPASSVSQALKPSLSRKASAKLKGAMVTMDVSFGPQVQRVLQSINQTPVCFAVNTQSNTLIVGERGESHCVANLFFVLNIFY